MSLRTIVAMGLLSAFATPGGAQPTADPSASAVFTALDGAWRGEGTLMGRPAAFRMEWADRGAFATLHFTNAFSSADGPDSPVMQAAAVYRTAPGDPSGAWLDSRGVRFDLTWTATDSSLVVEWRGTDESGRTAYVVRGPDTLEVVDEVRTEGGWRAFARGVYARVVTPPR